YERKLAEGKSRKEALRAFKRRISDAVYRQLVVDAAKAGPGGQTRDDSSIPAWPAEP
ncbi:MAG: IS110 family transposase, partial [Actinobacteria bacterium]